VAPNRGWDFRDYSIVVDAERVTGLMVRGGLFGLGEDGVFDVTHVGVVPNVTVEPGDVLTGQDVAELTPLDQAHAIEVINPNLGDNPSSFVASILFFPDGGQFLLSSDGELRDTYAFDIPAQTNEFAGVTYGAFVQRVPANGFNRYTQTIEPGTTTPTTTVELVELPAVLGRTGRRIRAILPEEASDSVQLTAIVQQTDGSFATEWRILKIDPGTDAEVTLPVPPDGLPDPLRGVAFVALDASGYAEGFTFDDAPGRARQAALRVQVGTDGQL